MTSRNPDRDDLSSPVTTVAPTLSERLRVETRDAHTAAERTGIMQPLLRGTITTPQYVALLQSLELLYTELESQLRRHAERPCIACIDLPALQRAEGLRRDIAVLRDTAESFVAPPSVAAYVASLRTLGDVQPDLLLSHAYLRYLGDLSGGRILMRIVGKALGRNDGAGLEFYAFPAIDDPDAFKRAFRERIDALELDEAGRDAIVREALAGFARHQAMFAELA